MYATQLDQVVCYYDDYNEIANLHSKHVLETVIRYGYDG